MISYAQNAEDVVLARVFGKRTDGFFVDIGANDPTHDSVTRHFYELGWHGVNIEPQTTCFADLQSARPRDVNLNVGVGSSAGQLTFYFVPDAQAMSTFSAEHAQLVRSLGYHTEERELDVRTLASVFAEHVGEQTVDFLKVDVEGLEAEVLGTFDWSRWRPRVVLVESSPDVSPWEEHLLVSGYRRTLWDGINLFFVRDEDADEFGPLLNRPATLALDRYDPWLYVEQLRGFRQRLASLLQHYLVDALGARAASANHEIAAAGVALGLVLSERPDVLDHFGAPPDIDLRGLLLWASRGQERAGEVGGPTLGQYHAVYARLATANGGDGLTLGAALRRAGESARGRIPATLRQRVTRLRRG